MIARLLALAAAVWLTVQAPGALDAPRNTRIRWQEAPGDSIGMVLQWNAPTMPPRSRPVTGYEYEIGWGATVGSYTMGVAGTHDGSPPLRVEVSVPVPCEMGDTIHYLAQVRAVVNDLTGPWGAATGEVTCQTVAPGAPTTTLDTLPPLDSLVLADPPVPMDSLVVEWERPGSRVIQAVDTLTFVALGQVAVGCTYTWRDGIRYRLPAEAAAPLEIVDPAGTIEVIPSPQHGQHCFTVTAVAETPAPPDTPPTPVDLLLSPGGAF